MYFSDLEPVCLCCSFFLHFWCICSCFSCQYQCKWLPRKTRLWNDLILLFF